MVDSIVESVRQDLLNRSMTGVKKYQVTLDREDIDLRGWLQHQYEELLDAALYCKRAIRELDPKYGLELGFIPKPESYPRVGSEDWLEDTDIPSTYTATNLDEWMAKHKVANELKGWVRTDTAQKQYQAMYPKERLQVDELLNKEEPENYYPDQEIN